MDWALIKAPPSNIAPKCFDYKDFTETIQTFFGGYRYEWVNLCIPKELNLSVNIINLHKFIPHQIKYLYHSIFDDVI